MAAAEIFDIGAWLAMAELMLQGEGAADGYALSAPARRRGYRHQHEREEVPEVWQMHVDTSADAFVSIECLYTHSRSEH